MPYLPYYAAEKVKENTILSLKCVRSKYIGIMKDDMLLIVFGDKHMFNTDY